MSNKPFVRWINIFSLFITTLVFISLVGFINIHTFDLAEFENLHASWLVNQGFVPYRDFYEHHTPILLYAFTPLFNFYRVTTNSHAAVESIYTSRLFMLILSMCITAIVLMIGKIWKNWTIGWISTILLGTTLIYYRKSVEFRPDLFATFLLMGLYRPNAWYFWIQHTQIGEVISAEAINKLLESLNNRTIAPR
jgi:hypothetical protein